ncbi:MAG: hypothetical protein ACQEWF_22810 [Bacillota bacterium]
MKFTLNVVLNIEGTNVVQGGTFYARSNNDVVKVAYEYIREIKTKSGMRDTVIIEVKVNGKHSIIEDVKNYENGDYTDPLPF